MLVLGVHVQLPGSTRGGGVHQAHPGGPSREHTWGRCTPGSSRGSGYTYQGAQVGDLRQARPGGPGTPTGEHMWGRCTPGLSRGPGKHTREHMWWRCTPGSFRGSRYTYKGARVGEVYARLLQRVQVHLLGSTCVGGGCHARPGGPCTTTRENTWGRCAPGSSRRSQQGAHMGEVYARLVQGVQVHIPGTPRGGGVRHARPRSPGIHSMEHMRGKGTPSLSRRSS